MYTQDQIIYRLRTDSPDECSIQLLCAAADEIETLQVELDAATTKINQLEFAIEYLKMTKD